MSDLTSQLISNTYKQIILVSSSTSNTGVNTSLKAVQTGDGTNTALKVATNAVQITGALGVGGAVSLDGNLHVDDKVCASAFYGDGSNLSGVTATIAGNISVSNATVGGNLYVGGTATVAGAAHLQSSLSVAGAAQFASTVTVVGAAQFQSTVTAVGAATFKSTVTVENVAALKNNVTVGGTFNVAGAAGFTSKSDFSNDVSVSGRLDVRTSVCIGGVLDVEGVANFATNVSVSGNLNVVGNVTAAFFYGDGRNLTNVQAEIGTATNISVSGFVNVGGNLSVSGTSNIVGAASFQSTVTVVGAATFKDDVSVSGNLNVGTNTSVGGTLITTGAATFASTVTVSGNADFKSNVSVSGNINVGGTVTVAGAVSLASTLSVGGAANFASTVTVEGATHLQSTASIAGNTVLGGTLRVAGATSLEGAVDLNSTLTVAGAVSLASTLSVGGVATFADDVVAPDEMSYEITTANLPASRATLDFNFTQSDVIDPRITFTRSSTAYKYNDKGTLQSVAANVGRLDYDPATLEPRGFLIEGAATNLLTYSEQFDNAAWTKFASSISADAVTSPDGTSNADNLLDTVATSNHYVYEDLSITANTNYAASVFVKSGTRNFVTLYWSNTGRTNGINATFDLSDGTIDTAAAAFGSGSNPAASIEDAGGGWYRVVVSGIVDASATTGRFGIYSSSTGGAITYTGDGSAVLALYGAQLETGTTQSSYIATSGATATRAAELATVTDLSWFNESAGTFVVDAELDSGASTEADLYFLALDDGTSNNRWNFWRESAGGSALKTYLAGKSGGSDAFTTIIIGDVWANGTIRKLGFAWDSAGATVAQEGASADVSGWVAAPTGITVLTIGRFGTSAAGYIDGHIRSITYYPQRLTNAQLVALSEA